MNIVDIRNYSALMVVFLYLLFNYGFQVIRIPSNNGIPIGELFFSITIVTFNYSLILKRLRGNYYFAFLFVWLLISLVHLIVDIPKYGFWAIRDASHSIESMYIFLGILSSRKIVDFLLQQYKFFSILVVVYALGYLFRDVIYEVLPEIPTSAGGKTYLFMYITTPSLLLLIGFSLLIDKNIVRNVVFRYFLFSIIFVYIMVVFQARTPILQFVALSFFLIYLNPKFLKHIFVVLIGFSFILFLYSISGLELPGRLGLSYSPEIFVNQVLAIFGFESDGLGNAAKGVGQRLEWWVAIYNKLSTSYSSFLFGIGYGVPLIDFQLPGGVIVREPHNSIISAFSRTGLLGVSFLLMFWLGLFMKWVDVHKKARRLELDRTVFMLRVLMIFFILVWMYSIGEDAFEKPFWAIPFYFFWGVVIKITADIKLIRRLG